MPRISEDYREQNRALHASNEAYGTNSSQWVPYVRKLAETEMFRDILDYGCGKQKLRAGLEDMNTVSIWGYDPAIEGLDAEPKPAELVVCTDVLEHIEPVHLNAVLRHLASLTQRKLLVSIATVPSTKSLPDGRNAHLIVKDGDWWREKLAQHFRVGLWQRRDNLGFVYGELLPKTGRQILARRTERLPMRPEWQQMVEAIRSQNHKYSDAWGRLHSFNMWQGVDDVRADMQIVLGLLEFAEDIDLELQSCVKMAAKAVLIMVPVTEELSEGFWRRCLERYLRLGDWQVDEIPGNGKRLVCCGMPMVGVMGITAVGAVDSEERWGQVQAACALISGRIQGAEPHGRRAILACYGPSLKATLPMLKEEAEATGAAVISVSGAHDMLIEAGIIPTYHVECDPRPHKTQNMNAAHPGVEYLIASTVHPNYFEKLAGHNVRLWHVNTPEHNLRLVDELRESPDTLISGGGSVGLRSIPLLYNMGYRDFSIYAMDCSFESDGETVQQWAGKHAGKKQDCVEVLCGQRLFISSPVLLTYATGFFEVLQMARDVDFRLYGDGLLQNMCKLYEGLDQVAHVVVGSGVAPLEEGKAA